MFFLLLLAAALPDAQQQAALDRISAASMRGNLSFLSSDSMEGRDTPSKGLEIASEFIASRFRKAGLEPVSDGDYFQKAAYLLVTPDLTDFDLTLDNGASSLHVNKDFDLQSLSALDLKSIPVSKVTTAEPGDLTGKAAVLDVPGRDKYSEFTQILRATQQAHPALILLLPRENGRRVPNTRLVAADSAGHSAPTVTVRDHEGEEFLSGNKNLAVSLHAKAATQKQVDLRNVAGVLRGSDPALRDTYVLVTAHYDHIGVLPPSSEGDRIYNGANDDGSGTVSVVEIADSLAQMPTHPKRSILFMCFFGEEKGLFGSRYYAAHPLFPLRQTVAQINLEQLGRTDDSAGPQVASATFTGFTFSDLPATFAKAGTITGIRVYENEQNSDSFFSRSDNQSLADAGIPAHTLAVAFEFPDYHRAGDEWQKIDYDNMAKVDRMVTLGLLDVANSEQVPHWNAANPKTERYRKAAAK